MAQKQVTDRLSIYIPQSKSAQKPAERLMALSEKKDRSVSYLVVEAILEYLKGQEKER
jgi:predicted DNA-binding protein